MSQSELKSQLARQESLNDHLITEVECLNHLLQKVGFEEGLSTLKQAAKDLENLDEDLDSYEID